MDDDQPRSVSESLSASLAMNNGKFVIDDTDDDNVGGSGGTNTYRYGAGDDTDNGRMTSTSIGDLVQVGSTDSVPLYDDEEETEFYSSLPTPEELRNNQQMDLAAASHGHNLRMANVFDIDHSKHEEDYDFEAKRSTNTFFKSRTCCKACVICALIVMIISLITLGLAVSNSGSRSGRKFDTKELTNYLRSQHGILVHSNNDSLSTPLYLAAQWMAETDDAAFDLPTDSEVSDYQYKFLTRYIMALLYFSLSNENQSSWLSNLNFLTNRDICDWKGSVLNLDGVPEKAGIWCDPDSRIETISIPYNNLAGTLPSELGLLTTLYAVDFNYNYNIKGKIPTTLCQLTNLQLISFVYNQIYGSIPSCLGDLLELKRLHLSNNLLTGSMPKEMFGLTNLLRIIVDDNQLSGDPTFLFHNMENLTVLLLSNNTFSGHIDNLFEGKNRASLTLLDLSQNNFEAKDPSSPISLHLFKMDRLEVLDLSHNRLTGILPLHIPLNQKLSYLSFHNNALHGTIPSSIQNLTNLTHLDLSNNGFNGTIPSELMYLTNLESLFLSINRHFTPGEIPEFISNNLTSLRELSLRDTARTGLLPTHIGSLKNMVMLDVGMNNFTGTVPHSWGKLLNLEYLLVNHNVQLIGTIPDAMKHLKILRAGFFDGTQMNGTLDELCLLPSFQVQNETLDANGTPITEKGILYADCGGPNPTITCPCCTRCCDTSIITTGCSRPELAALDAEWENGFRRRTFNFLSKTDIDYTKDNGEFVVSSDHDN